MVVVLSTCLPSIIPKTTVKMAPPLRRFQNPSTHSLCSSVSGTEKPLAREIIANASSTPMPWDLSRQAATRARPPDPIRTMDDYRLPCPQFLQDQVDSTACFGHGERHASIGDRERNETKAAFAAEPFFVLEFKFGNFVGGEQRDEHVDARLGEGLQFVAQPIAATGTGQWCAPAHLRRTGYRLRPSWQLLTVA